MIPQKIGNLKFALLLGLELLAIILLFMLFFTMTKKDDQNNDLLKAVATELEGAGLYDEAAKYYEKFLLESEIDKKEKAMVAFSIAELFSKSGYYEKSLPWYYYVRAILPDSETAQKSSKEIVSLLEKTGRISAAKSMLKQSTSLEKNEKGGIIVAKINDRNIFLSDLDEAIDFLPNQIKKEISKNKRQFLKQYVVEEVLLEKAKRLKINEEKKFKLNLKMFERQLLIQKILDDEVYKKISVDENDLKNFYTANLTKYSDKGKKTPSFEEVKDKVLADYKAQKSQKLYSELMEKTLKNDDIKLFEENLK